MVNNVFQSKLPNFDHLSRHKSILSLKLTIVTSQLALFIMAWAALWSFVSGYIYTAGTPKDLSYNRTYDGVAHADFDKEITMVYFEDHVSIVTS